MEEKNLFHENPVKVRSFDGIGLPERGAVATGPTLLWTIPGFGAVYNNYLCTYDLYGPVRNVFDAGRYMTWGSGGGGVGAGNLEFCGPL
jgi:hypothetical protein